MKLLAIVAHPDDAAIFCGGTLAKHSARGDDVHVVYMTRGEYGGTKNSTQAEVAEQRSQESKQAAEELGVTTSFLDFQDGRIEYSLNNRSRINEVIRNQDPDLLLTHELNDDHPDHRITSQLVQDAYYMASLPLVESEIDPVDPDNIYKFSKPSSGFEPNVFVNISDVFKRKENAVRCHKSQIEFLKDHGGLDRKFDNLMEDVRSQARNYGRRANVRFAEGFMSLHEEPQAYLG